MTRGDSGNVVLLGFDIREGGDTTHIGYSIDRAIWPTLYPEEYEWYRVDETLPHCFLWKEEGALYSAVANFIGSAPEEPIEIMVWSTRTYLRAINEAEHNPLGAIVADTGAHVGWTCIGFDVADIWLTSFVHNCTLLGEAEQLRKVDIGRVSNDLGLVDRLEDALQLCRHADSAIPSHAPFYPFQLYIRDAWNMR